MQCILHPLSQRRYNTCTRLFIRFFEQVHSTNEYSGNRSIFAGENTSNAPNTHVHLKQTQARCLNRKGIHFFMGRGQATLECCIAVIVFMVLACPCIEVGRMALDSLTVKTAAADLARAAAADEGGFEAQAFLAASYPALKNAHTQVSWQAPQIEPYQHHFIKEDGRLLTRPSNASSQQVDVQVSLTQGFITPLGSILSSLGISQGYTVSGTGMALRDSTAQSGRW